jgi:primosomal protein N' (replication factor Y) (superfamily II helicase)
MNPVANQFADVILPLPVAGYFTYNVPDELKGQVVPGARVIVQFGVKKFYSALVHEIHDRKPEGYNTKPIEYLIDVNPIIPFDCFPFWEWIAGYYHCTIGEVLKAALPSGLKLESETRINYNSNYTEQRNEKLTPKEQLLFEVIREKRSLSISELNNSVLRKNSIAVVKELLGKGAVSIEEEMKESYRLKTEAVVELPERLRNEKMINLALDALKKVPLQQKLLISYLELSDIWNRGSEIVVTKKKLLHSTGIGVTVLNGLVKKKILSVIDQKVDRLASYKGEINEVSELSPAQINTLNQIKQSFKSKPVTLLHGVTSSGKTEIYIKLIKENLDKGKQVLYLLPEIGLTTQIISRLTRVFGDKAGVYHSKFNDSERVEIWNKVLNFENTKFDQNQESDYQLIVGTRSALFLPFQNLGLIVVDEEHDNSYKQYDPAPRYHARDAAIILGHLHQVPVLLGTATPSVETYYNAISGKFGLATLNERHQNIEMPEIVTADFKDAYRRKQMKSHLTPLLFDEITGALERKEQVILFQNRRGFSPFIECKMCGWVPKCTHCDVSLTYHKHNNSLVCHYCGFSTNHPGTCRSCGNKEMTNKGFGTEKVEEDLQVIFPGARIDRMDLDTTRSKKGFEKIIQSFEQGDIDILIGTQMVTKGLDFDNVSVVGILNADNLLNQPDFRAYERSYQLMAQVGGRSGRKNKQGKVIIQTSEPANSIICNVINNDYEAMYRGQIAERRHFKYPPFYRMIGITLKHRERNELDRIAQELSSDLRERFGSRILGPEYPVISRIKTLYIKQLWIKIEREVSVVNAKRQMQEIIDHVKSNAGNKTILIAIDVDPV